MINDASFKITLMTKKCKLKDIFNTESFKTESSSFSLKNMSRAQNRFCAGVR